MGLLNRGPLAHGLPEFREAAKRLLSEDLGATTSMRLEAKRFVPFTPTPGGDQDGFTHDGEEQRVEYPFHCNVPTRIYFDVTGYDVLLQRDAEGRMSILIAPKEGVKTSSV
jgi:hypothetical protein